MAIFKETGEQYIAVPTAVFRDANLSMTEIGLLVALYSLVGDTRFSLDAIQGAGNSSKRAAFRKLVRKGYIVLKKNRGTDGRFECTDLILTIPDQAMDLQE